MLQMVSEPILTVSRARTGQVRRIRGSVRVRDVGTYAWRVGPLGGTRHGTYAANWTCGTRMPILYIRTWPRGGVPGLGTDEDVGLLRGWIVTSPGLTGLIAYLYHQVATSFLEARLQRTPGLSVLGPEQFQDG
jgi:hypothetical protein